jgi:glycosyltransferase involved in cell wall biosynthesis
LKISIVVFTLNEIDGMKAVLARIKKEWFDELIVIDGGSTDGTIEFARQCGYPVTIQKEKGAGAAFKEAMERVSGDIIIPFSPDGNFIPEKIPELLKKINEGYSIVTVSRYRDGARSYDDDRVTAFGNKMFTGMINLLFRAHLTDSLYGYFAFQRSLIGQFKIGATSAWGPQLLIRATKRGVRVGEIPGDEPKRIGGVRKMQPLKNGLDILRMIVKELFTRKF